MTAMTVLAKTSEGAKAGPIGLAVIILLCVACYFLFKSMSKHLRRVREEFPTDPPADPAADDAHDRDGASGDGASEPYTSDHSSLPPSPQQPGV